MAVDLIGTKRCLVTFVFDVPPGMHPEMAVEVFRGACSLAGSVIPMCKGMNVRVKTPVEVDALLAQLNGGPG